MWQWFSKHRSHFILDSLCFNSSAAEIQPSGAALFCPVFGRLWCSAAQPTYTGTICRMYCT